MIRPLCLDACHRGRCCPLAPQPVSKNYYQIFSKITSKNTKIYFFYFCSISLEIYQSEDLFKMPVRNARSRAQRRRRAQAASQNDDVIADARRQEVREEINQRRR